MHSSSGSKEKPLLKVPLEAISGPKGRHFLAGDIAQDEPFRERMSDLEKRGICFPYRKFNIPAYSKNPVPEARERIFSSRI